MSDKEITEKSGLMKYLLPGIRMEGRIVHAEQLLLHILYT